MKLTKEEMLAWMLDKVKSSTNPYDAECWLVTARTLGINYDVDLCAYKFHCQHKNITSAAETLQRMYMNFSSESRFWDEITQLIEAVRNETATDETSSFNRAVFQHILPDFQQTILLDLVEKQKDKVEKCRLLLLLLRLFPDSAETFGMQLIDVLTELEKNAQAMESHENIYTQLLVCDVLPILLRSQALALSETVCLELFKRAVRFYLSNVSSFQRRKQNTATGIVNSNAASPRTQRFKSSSRGTETPVSDYHHHVTDSSGSGNRFSDSNWDSLLHCFSLIAEKCRWGVGKKLKAFRLDHMCNILSLLESSSPSKMETIYTTLVIFMNLVFKYSQLVGNSTSKEGPSDGVVLVPPMLRESQVPSLVQSDDPTPAKIRKSLSSFPKDNLADVAFIPLSDSSKGLTEVFSAGTLCSKLLNDKHRDDLVEKLLPAEKLVWVKQFVRDSLLLNGDFQRIIKDLETKPNEDADGTLIEKLQMASCYLGMDEPTKSIKILLEANEIFVSGEPTPTLSDGQLQQFGLDEWHFTFLSQGQMASYCLRCLIYCVERKFLESSIWSDALLGHAIVVSQYGWPKLAWRFKAVMNHIMSTAAQKKRSKFSYPKLFNYVYSMDMLEEMAYLNANKGTDLALDITETETRKVGANTRHSVKGQRDDVRSLLEVQANTCGNTPSLYEVTLMFLNEQKDSLIESL